MRRSIGFFDDGLHRAGTGRYLAEVIGGLNRDRYSPVFFAPVPRLWHEDLSALGTEMIYLGGEPGALSGGESGISVDASPRTLSKSRRLKIPPVAAWSMGMMRETMRLRKLFLKRKVDLLHSNNTGAEPAPIAARLAGIHRVIGTFHVLPSYDLQGVRGGKHYRQLEKWSMGALHHATSCCVAAAKEWRERCGFPESLVTVIHNGIEVARIARKRSKEEARKSLSLPPDSVVIAAIGNLHEYKGYEHLLRAMPKLLKLCPKACVLVAGTGPLEADLKSLAILLGVERQVLFLGFCNDVSLLLDCADVYVQPSLVEAFPIAILEASGSGLPVVATSIGGVPEAILNGKTGILVPPKDSASLAAALETLALNRDLCEAMGEAGRQRVASLFTRELMVSKTTEVYERVLST